MYGEGGMEGEYVPNFTVAYSQGGRSKIPSFNVRNTLIFIYKQLGSGLSSQSLLIFSSFSGLKVA